MAKLANLFCSELGRWVTFLITSCIKSVTSLNFIVRVHVANGYISVIWSVIWCRIEDKLNGNAASSGQTDQRCECWMIIGFYLSIENIDQFYYIFHWKTQNSSRCFSPAPGEQSEDPDPTQWERIKEMHNRNVYVSRCSSQPQTNLPLLLTSFQISRENNRPYLKGRKCQHKPQSLNNSYQFRCGRKRKVKYESRDLIESGSGEPILYVNILITPLTVLETNE